MVGLLGSECHEKLVAKVCGTSMVRYGMCVMPRVTCGMFQVLRMYLVLGSYIRRYNTEHYGLRTANVLVSVPHRPHGFKIRS